MRHLALILLSTLVLSFLSPRATGQDVLAYTPLQWMGLQWYSGYAGLNVTLVDETQWSTMTMAQFASYDLIWVGSTSSGATGPYDTMFNNRMEWSPTITGRIVAMGLDPEAHATTGAMQLIEDCATWLLGSGGTSLFLGTEAGAVGMSFMDQFGLVGCTPVNCFNQETVQVVAPAHPTMAGSTTASLSGWGQSTHSRFTTVPAGWLTVATGPAAEPVIVVAEGGPSCALTSPPAGSTVSGDVALTLDGDDPEGDPVSLTFDYSVDAGVTWQTATAAVGSPLPNPAMGLPTPIAAAGFTWDSLLDGVGIASITSALVRVSISDGTTAGACSVAVNVDNVVPPPSCLLTLPAGTASGEIGLTVDSSSPSFPVVDILVEYSTDGGASFLPATMAMASPYPNPASMVPVGPAGFTWDSRTDAIGLGALVPGVVVRATVTDGAAVTSGTCSGIVDIDNTQVCGGICGDCNLNALGPDILDALAAAQIAAGLIVPTIEQQACCDVNISGTVDVLDGLLIAQAAAGLPVVLVCI